MSGPVRGGVAGAAWVRHAEVCGLGPTPECGYHNSAVRRGDRSTRAPLIGLRRRRSRGAVCGLAGCA